jgi:hypothetical protein
VAAFLRKAKLHDGATLARAGRRVDGTGRVLILRLSRAWVQLTQCTLLPRQAPPRWRGACECYGMLWL